MLFVSSGLGLLVISMLLVSAVATGALAQTGFTMAGRPDLAFLAASLGLLAAAGVNWVVGRRLNRQPGREMIDARTGERVLLRRRHALFWIPMEYWSIPVALAALVPLLALRG
ncbi:hypothetical protein [Muricoccus vinaceus]|uniref:Uncharacterized protein n=1 Tax=Muricoccus vinaceus TaxID=424704 RepID=A0ABV6INW5_9PROT